jgi:hypothetical protein
MKLLIADGARSRGGVSADARSQAPVEKVVENDCQLINNNHHSAPQQPKYIL